MKNKIYEEIRANTELIDYAELFTGKHSLWCETYEDAENFYKVLFTPASDSNPLIQKINKNDQ